MLRLVRNAFRGPNGSSGASPSLLGRFAKPALKARWYRHCNFGDTLTPVILAHFTGRRVKYSKRAGKILAVGSVIQFAAEGDTIWGTGLIKDERLQLPRVEVLALRGPLTARNCGLKTDVYGDPAILLPLIYHPRREKKHAVGMIPHYVDKHLAKEGRIIDIEAPWRDVIDSVLECDRIVSSSLHGIIAAEAYGIPAEWRPLSDRVIGGHFKFHDYLLGTGRDAQGPGELPPMPDIEARRQRLLDALAARHAIQSKAAVA